MTAGIQEVVYRRPSALAGDGLVLETAGRHASYFTGFLTAARPAAMGLATLADVAAADFRRDQIGTRGLRDPVVTCAQERLRFETLSGCCGLYARLDVLPAALDGEIRARGTTNVDVNPPLYTALTQVGGGDRLRLTIGPDELAVTTRNAHVVEKRVPLPERWLRGLAEAGFLAAGFDLRAEIPGGHAAALLHRLPAHRGDDRWFVPAGRSVRATSVAAPGAVCLAGAHRLSLVRPLLPFTRTLRLYGPPVAAGSAPTASGWEFDLGAVRFSVLLSPGINRGLSGEGGLLPHLAAADPLADELGGDGTVDPAASANSEGLSGAQVRGALAALATSGTVGYDWSEAGWFHRELPYRPDLLAVAHPRHAAARALVAAGEIEPVAGGYRVGTRLVHRGADGTWGCTCPWWSERYGRRGPCKHVLAVSLLAAGGPA
ncbi:SWIM zinc finger family protein [Cryptosporangium arvum]|uniref:Zinc finger protein, SWIM type n=1 Tax=Cryptosporangium arvum DSM 44712 TaxID=927661 RepID=A0A010ZYZ1_9ACTN|nr:SWIM zinc finger family protein [Cryptosporangium arvum]EXG82432.1 zinc finger protein, SWIM type [Cryptosporangium arvum DSM 44712]